jgi:glycogen debranching enzyme
VQGYVYAAKRLAARCAARLGKAERARSLEEAARDLAVRFETSFWCAELDSYALALDGDKRPCRVRCSNAGQVLFTGIAAAERATRVADALMRPQFFSGWGIRTVANTEARYNPMSYHNGSIWPHDNALIALGLARYNRKRSVERLFRSLFEAAIYMEMRRLPELFCGFQRGRGRGPTYYPVACSPQAWASATPFTLLEASLGVEFDPFANEIRLRNPRLPDFLDWVVLRNLQLGSSSVDLKVHRHANEVSVELLARRGLVHVAILFE